MDTNNKKEGEKVREYLGGDCYGYYTYCEHCKNKITGFTANEADKKWENHKC
ncbi:hypothetical protein KA005_01450 [bacterium]|nr:hypothetical protein [bacterium]